MRRMDDPNPVLFLNTKALYRAVRGDVAPNRFHTPIGKARLLRIGSQFTLITYGMGVHWALDVL